MIATTIEQAEDLVKAGVSPHTADMHWYASAYTRNDDGKLVPQKSGIIYLVNTPPEKEWHIPAWSISALWDILHSLDKTYEFPTTFSADELIAQLVMILCIKFKMG